MKLSVHSAADGRPTRRRLDALRLVRGILLRGADLVELWPSALALLAFTAVMMAVAISRFRKRLD